MLSQTKEVIREAKTIADIYEEITHSDGSWRSGCYIKILGDKNDKDN